ncbi:family 43 glycosylhydrolase [Pedobacter psychroterrae]|uniref:BNR repeat protein n=1 Tax=Pedobacter psychroterrae TaxID=2530453 RepID=A0A4R0NLS9_9SPHI|nr:family 43 glycosylhydrolase [Pedobacter psychroterrae]TCD01139.1 hypothetical protein EZ437_10245 [Pedobacter psychroterrae]
MNLYLQSLRALCVVGALILISCGINKAGSEGAGKVAGEAVKQDAGKRIVWDQSTLTKVSSVKANHRYTSYPRIIQLYDQSLLGIYEADGGVVTVKSRDLGGTWSEPITVALRDSGVNMAVPDVLELKDHTLLAFYNPRPSKNATGKRFGIRVKKSADGGITWKDEQLLYEAGYKFENGCWEPSAMQLPSGEIQVFFANEAEYTQSNEQNISLLRSKDNGLSWTKKPETVSFRKGSRDGMPVPLFLDKRKEMVFAIEDNGFGNFKPYLIRNTIKENWASPADASSENRTYALSEKIADSIYAGSPYLRQLGTGETILSYQGTEGRTNKMQFADMKVVVGDGQARNFGGKTTPFIIPANKSCLWNSLTVLGDNTIIAVTATNAYADRSEIWMIKGRLLPGEAGQSVMKKDTIFLADPTIFLDKETYYLYGTSSEKGFLVYESSDLKNWKGPVGANKGFALSKGESFGTKGFWAPQVFKHKGIYYMAYTADEQIAIATSNSPIGPFKQEVLKPLSGTGNQIDPFVFFDKDGKPYMYHVKLQKGNRIFVTPMKADLSDVLPEAATECISGTLPWENTENTEWAVTEGPTVIRHKDLYYLIYSANDFRNKDYAVGYATSDSPLGPWRKFEGSPIISRKQFHLNGSGHGDLFKDKSGNYQYVLHVHRSQTKVSPRISGLTGIKFKKQNGQADLLVAEESSLKILVTDNSKVAEK